MEKARYWRHSRHVLIAGADASDYFNYGFDEFTWAAYCSKQTNIRKEFNPTNVMAVWLLFLEHR